MTDLRSNLGAHRRATRCDHCGVLRPPHDKTCPKAKQGRNNRKRGGAWELTVSRVLAEAFPDARKTGPLGGPDDVTAGPLVIQAKAVASLYPKQLDRLLADLEPRITADQYPVLAIKHPGHERRHKLVVMDLYDFVMLLRGRSRPPAELPDIPLYDPDTGEV